MICDPLSSQTKHSRQASQGILSHEAAHHKEHTLMFDAFLTIATHRGLRRGEGVRGGSGSLNHQGYSPLPIFGGGHYATKKLLHLSLENAIRTAECLDPPPVLDRYLLPF